MMNRTRRLAPAIAVLAAVGMLTGCSGKGGESGNNKVDTENESTAQKAQGPEKNAASREARGHATVETDMGQVEIPINPENIVTDYYLGEFLAVDVKPPSRPRIPCRIRFWRIRQEGIREMDVAARDFPGNDRCAGAGLDRDHHRGRL